MTLVKLRLNGLHVLSCILLSISCYYGDALTSLNTKHGLLLRSVTDNLVHGTLAVITWLLGYVGYRSQETHVTRANGNNRFSNHSSLMLSHTKIILQAITCGMLACGIDIDHFISARSWKLEDAVEATNRGLFHNSFLVVLVLVYYYTHRRSLTVIIIVGMVAHHLRDSIRRGLYFYPLGSTPPLPYSIYLFCICMLMLVFPYMLPKRERTIYMVPQMA